MPLFFVLGLGATVLGLVYSQTKGGSSGGGIRTTSGFGAPPGVSTGDAGDRGFAEATITSAMASALWDMSRRYTAVLNAVLGLPDGPTYGPMRRALPVHAAAFDRFYRAWLHDGLSFEQSKRAFDENFPRFKHKLEGWEQAGRDAGAQWFNV
ncbi:MAG: hypothetical protein ACHREM_20815 [Polyangiales bacterium]